MSLSCPGRSLLPLAALLIALTAPAPLLAQKPPVTGPAVAAFEPLDRALLEFRESIGCQAVTVAVARDGKLLYSRGYGWQDANKKQSTKPDALMRIASISKAITNAATRKLIREGKLTLDTRAFDLLKLTPPPGAKPDPRLGKVTVAHLLEHKGGWDHKRDADPMFESRKAEQALQLKRPAQPGDVVRYMLGRPLQFDPGEREAYSNFGYCVLGRVIEKASGKPYLTYVQQELCKPLGIAAIKPARTATKDRDPKEVWYPGGDLVMEVMDAHGGLIASAPALCTYLENYWLGGEPRKVGEQQEWTYFGSLPGTTAMARQRPDGYNLAVLCNGRREDAYAGDNERLKRVVDEAMEKVAKAVGR